MKRHGNRLESAVTSILSPSNYDFLLFVRGEIKRASRMPPHVAQRDTPADPQLRGISFGIDGAGSSTGPAGSI